MPSLHCAVVGQQTVFPVNIELNCTVHELKEIITQNKFPFPARSLELYLAKKDGSWLKVEDLGELLKGGVDEICGRYTEMCPLLELDLEYFGVDFASSPESLHILVVSPERGIEVRNLEPPFGAGMLPLCFTRVSVASAASAGCHRVPERLHTPDHVIAHAVACHCVIARAQCHRAIAAVDEQDNPAIGTNEQPHLGLRKRVSCILERETLAACSNRNRVRRARNPAADFDAHAAIASTIVRGS
ncbi:hypothetical protein FI667_g16691, partial [Globisporangium splendens]